MIMALIRGFKDMFMLRLPSVMRETPRRAQLTNFDACMHPDTKVDAETQAVIMPIIFSLIPAR